jgi:hypothetical protein
MLPPQFNAVGSTRWLGCEPFPCTAVPDKPVTHNAGQKHNAGDHGLDEEFRERPCRCLETSGVCDEYLSARTVRHPSEQ